MESATSMLERIEPVLQREYPHAPSAIREQVLGWLSYEAGRSEAYFLLLKDAYTTEMRVDLWTSVMRVMMRQALAGIAETN